MHEVQDPGSTDRLKGPARSSAGPFLFNSLPLPRFSGALRGSGALFLQQPAENGDVLFLI